MNASVHVFTLDCLRNSVCGPSVTPFLQSFPLQWSRCYSSGTWTLPSHVSLFSGQTPVEHGVTRPGETVPRDVAVLPRSAKDAGYTTAIFSENPTFSSDTGFDHYIDATHDEIQRKLFCSDFSPFDHVDELSVTEAVSLVGEILSRPNRLRNVANTGYAGYRRFSNRTPSYPHHGRRVFSHLESHLARTDGPTLTVTNVLDPHNPYYGVPPGSENSRSSRERDAMHAGGWNMVYMLTEEHPPDVIRSVYGDWETFFEAKKDVYEQFSREADRLLKRWQDKQTDRFEDGLVVAVGDHGQLFGTEGMYGHHMSLHPYGVHVPLAVDPPSGWDESERTLESPVSLAGVGRTLMDVVAGDVDGTDEFVDSLAAYSREPGGGVVVCADGPTWSLPPLYEHDRFDDSLVDALAVRKAGLVYDEYVDVYQSHWANRTVERTSFKYAAGSRERVSDRDPPPLPDDVEQWLSRTDDATDHGRENVNDRLENLGYV